MIPELNIYRYQTGDQGTRGIAWLPGFWAHSLELPWRDNQTNISCIPAGEYDIEFVTARRRIGGLRQMYWLREVDNRTGVLIHPGTFAGDKRKGFKSSVLGCILLGHDIGTYKQQQAIFETRGAVLALHDALNRQPAKLIIKEGFSHA